MSNYIKNKLTMEQKELTYVAPEVEVIEVEVEVGFNGSGGTGSTNPYTPNSPY
jgi:hypothetical protein